MVMNLKGKGLVMLSGCSQSAAINVLRQAQRLSGEDRVHAFIGGMHLTGGTFDPLIPRTLDELVAIAPRWLVLGHCTGCKVTHEIVRRPLDVSLFRDVSQTVVFGTLPVLLQKAYLRSYFYSEPLVGAGVP
jgi:7,8-dihydropterin-6-yl-methyl-4-(beta-D-ribofuranosyl)aminobenzene 5'-phosphate synthase